MLDFFGGSGTTGAVAMKLNRKFVLVDQNPEAIDIMRQRLGAGLLGCSIEYRGANAAAGDASLECT